MTNRSSQKLNINLKKVACIWKWLQYVAPKLAEEEHKATPFSIFHTDTRLMLPASSRAPQQQNKMTLMRGVSFIWSNSYYHRGSSCPLRWVGGYPTSHWWSKWSPKSLTVETREGWLPNSGLREGKKNIERHYWDRERKWYCTSHWCYHKVTSLILQKNIHVI